VVSMEGDCLPHFRIIGADAANLEDQNKDGKALYIFKIKRNSPY